MEDWQCKDKGKGLSELTVAEMDEMYKRAMSNGNKVQSSVDRLIMGAMANQKVSGVDEVVPIDKPKTENPGEITIVQNEI